MRFRNALGRVVRPVRHHRGVPHEERLSLKLVHELEDRLHAVTGRSAAWGDVAVLVGRLAVRESRRWK